MYMAMASDLSTLDLAIPTTIQAVPEWTARAGRSCRPQPSPLHRRPFHGGGDVCTTAVITSTARRPSQACTAWPRATPPLSTAPLLDVPVSRAVQFVRPAEHPIA
ncbi:hypothetical protein C8Q77DRAFT_1082626 [Trametes polyzona]|nr:hypothetical protein C8Q77DRAFT_1082626 [Trametes polyzona]